MEMEESLRQLVSCSICLEVVADQKQLPCQHTVCVDCMLQLTGHKLRVPCPVCKKNVTVPTGGVRKLPDCMLIKQMVDLLSPHSEDWNSDLEAADDFGLRSLFDEGDSANSTAGGATGGATGGARKLAIGPEFDNHRDKRANHKVNCLMKLLKKQLSTAKVQVAEKNCKLITVEASIDGAISEIKRSCEAKVLSLEHSKLVHCDEIRSGVEECSRRVQVYEELGRDLESYSTTPTNGYSTEQRAKIRKIEKKLASLYKTTYTTTSKDRTDFKEGDRVRILPNASNCTAADLMYAEVAFDTVGIFMKKIDDRPSHYGRDRTSQQKKVWVMFPEKINWVGDVRNICHTNEKAKLPFKGDKIRVTREQNTYHPGREDTQNRSQKRPATLLDIVSDSSNTVDSSKDVKAVVQYANSSSKDRILYEDVDFFTKHHFRAGDKVRIDSTIEEPSQGWGRINGSSMGSIKSVSGGKQTGDTEVVVEFEEDSDWSGVLNDVELYVTPSVGDQVQVKLSVREPYLKWGGVTHSSRGILEKIKNDLQLGKVAEIKIKDRSELFKCLLSELELARYESRAGESAGARGGDNPADFLSPHDLALGYMMATNDLLFDSYNGYPRYDDDDEEDEDYDDYDDDSYIYDPDY